ncbi:MAG: hypothetical protein IJA44_03900 [Clostridia bacterium]|nr:hypothetical protein [Clostridia bacterium]
MNKSDSKRLKKLEKQRKEYISLQGKRASLVKKIEAEKSRSVFKNALSVFSFPFKKRAFSNLNEALISTIFIAYGLVSPFLLIAVIFCALVDLVYMLLYVIFFPFTCLYFLIFKEKRIARFEKKAEKMQRLLEQRTSATQLYKEINKIKKKNEVKYTPTTSSSRMEQTQYYKDKKDEYYRMYMGFPPKEESSGLSYLSTDTTLDLHPGDY